MIKKLLILFCSLFFYFHCHCQSITNVTDNGLIKVIQWTDTNGFDHVEQIFNEPIMGMKIQNETLIHTNILSEWKPIHKIQKFDGMSVWPIEQNESSVQALFFPIVGYRNFDGVRVFGEYESWFYYFTYIRTNFKEKCVITIVKHNDSVIVANIRPEHIDSLEDYGYLSYIGPRMAGSYNSYVLTYYFIKNRNKKWTPYSQWVPNPLSDATPLGTPPIITNFINLLNSGQKNIILK